MGLRDLLHDPDRGQHQGHPEGRAGRERDVLAPAPQRDEDDGGQGGLDRPAPPAERHGQAMADQRLHGLGDRGGRLAGGLLRHALGTIS